MQQVDVAKWVDDSGMMREYAADLETAADRLMGYGTETAAIVGRERRQIGRAGSGRVE